MEDDTTETTVEEQSEVSESEELYRSRRRRRRRRRRRSEVKTDVFGYNFDIPGISKLALSPLTQKIIGCIVGENVTSESPWTYVKKEVLEDNLELHAESSEFLPIKEEIFKYPQLDVLVGYAPDESGDVDEFYICLTEEAHQSITKMISKIKEEQEARLYNSVFKEIKQWKSLGSEPEVEEYMITNNRPLLEVEVETEYPIMSSKVHFRLRPVEAARDGYAEILCSRYNFSNIYKKRIDAMVQVAPTYQTNETQTTCTFPTNVWTQYTFELGEWKPSKQYHKNVKDFVTYRLDGICDAIRVNSFLNLYSNDYVKLVTDKSFTRIPFTIHFPESMSFAEIHLCKDKMISSIEWHPMWSGTFAAAYVDTYGFTYVKERKIKDQVARETYESNPVLIWSFMDNLKPKLYLESHKQITSLSFCPYDENVLIGGCANGQIIIWDIRNKLQQVEEIEIRTAAQQKYRTLLYSLIQWLKHSDDISSVAPAAVSDLEHSHRGSVTDIKWLSPFCEVTKTGRFLEIPQAEERTSLQFLTTGKDGTVLIWDLKAKVTSKPGGYKPRKKSRRLKERPSALTLSVSPYRILNRVLKPQYKINIPVPNGFRPLPLTALAIPTTSVRYEEVNFDPKRKLTLSNRITYKPNVIREDIILKPEISVGTAEGDVVTGKWEGFDFNSGEVVNSEIYKGDSFAKAHDGPVVYLGRSRFDQDLLLSIGGKVFAIWKIGFGNRPIFWRRCKGIYTNGSWGKLNPGTILLCRLDGICEFWNLVYKTHESVFHQEISGYVVTSLSYHPLKLKEPVIGVADHNGAFRLFNLPKKWEGSLEEVIYTDILISREINRKKEFIAWQNEWNGKNAKWIHEKREQEILAEKRRLEDAEVEKERLAEEQARHEKEEARLAALALIPPPGKYSEWAHQRWMKQEEERMNKVMLEKKQLNLELLAKQQKPLKQIAEEEVVKKQKQEELLNESENIFIETVAMLFPEVVAAKAPPPESPYERGKVMKNKVEYFYDFQKLSREILSYIELNPYTHQFNAKNIMESGYNRRKVLQGAHVLPSHRSRYESMKLLRKQEENARTAPFVKKMVVEVSDIESI